MQIEITPNRRVDAAEISSLEAALGVSLPNDYRDFLLKSNGGTPERNSSQTAPAGLVGVQFFYGIRKDKEWYEDLLAHRDFYARSRAPKCPADSLR